MCFQSGTQSGFAKEVEEGVPKTDVCRPPTADRPYVQNSNQ